MKSAIISIGEWPSMRGRYHISLTVDGETIYRRHDAGNNTGAAAASAISCAMGYDKYVIVASNEVANHIPIHLRSK